MAKSLDTNDRNQTAMGEPDVSAGGDWSDGITVQPLVVRWKEYSENAVGDRRGAIVEHAITSLKTQLQELERIQIVSEIEPDAYSLRALKALAEVRNAAVTAIHLVIDASIEVGTMSDTKLAQAAGISNSTVGKWRNKPLSFILTE